MLNRAELEAGQRGRPDRVIRVSQTRLERVIEPFTRADLEKVVPGQVERYIALGFHSEVYPKLEEDEAKARYRADFTLPKDAAQKPEYVGHLDVVSVHDPRIPLTRKHELAARIKELDLDEVARRWTTTRVDEWIDISNIEDLTTYPTDIPYLVFTHDGQKYRKISVTQAKKQFKDFEVGSPQGEVTDLFLQEPAFFVDIGIYGGGSRLRYGYIPFLDTFYGRPSVHAYSPGKPDAYWGVLSRGKIYIPLGS